MVNACGADLRRHTVPIRRLCRSRYPRIHATTACWRLPPASECCRCQVRRGWR
ncbi:hypothetical protein ACFOPN_02980 [Xanthomonas hyacinthi]|uniref:hypothetical protein n=1 Tax=Xanthomonas hyacinthi TaxID=56455 RepID=UPI003616343F